MTAVQAMYGAVCKGDNDTVRRVLRDNPEVISELAVNNSWLTLAAERGFVSTMECLIELGHSINPAGLPPLTKAIRKGATEAVSWLLERSDVELNTDRHEDRPLVAAVNVGDAALVQRLVTLGAEVEFEWGEFSMSPRKLAETYGESHREVVEVLS